nr:MAG TPA: hypothetical protein [Caudoviricetes sp.]
MSAGTKSSADSAPAFSFPSASEHTINTATAAHNTAEHIFLNIFTFSTSHIYYFYIYIHPVPKLALCPEKFPETHL